MLTHVIVRMLIVDTQGKVLLLVRSRQDSHRPGGYDLPGGKAEAGESYAEAVIRETAEEAGLRIVIDDVRLSYATAHCGVQSELKRPVNFVWLGYVSALPDDQTVALSHEHQAYEWCSLEAATAKLRDSTAYGFLRYVVDNGLLPEQR